MHRAPPGTLTTGRARKRRTMICATLLFVLLIVIVAWLGSFLGQGGGSSGDSESDNSTFTTEEFITGIDPFESTIHTEPSSSMTLTSTSKDEDAVKPAREEEARDREPCLTKSGLLCKSWVYFGHNVSG